MTPASDGSHTLDKESPSQWVATLNAAQPLPETTKRCGVEAQCARTVRMSRLTLWDPYRRALRRITLNVGWPRPEPQNPKALEPARACGKRS